MKPEKHYHIRWSNSNIDWKPFPTSEDASAVAETIKLRHESYEIIERDSQCERCMAFAAAAWNSQNGLNLRTDDPRRLHALSGKVHFE